MKDRLVEALDRLGLASQPTQILPVADIDPGVMPWHSRRWADPASVQRLALTVKEQGLQQPIAVRSALPDSSFRWLTLWGRQRLLAVAAAGLPEVPAIVCDVSDDNARILCLTENSARSQEHHFELGWAILPLLEKGHKACDIASILGCSPSSISDAKRIAAAIPEAALRALVAEQVPAEKQEEVFGQLVRLNRGYVRQFRDDAEAGDFDSLRSAITALHQERSVKEAIANHQGRSDLSQRVKVYGNGSKPGVDGTDVAQAALQSIAAAQSALHLAEEALAAVTVPSHPSPGSQRELRQPGDRSVKHGWLLLGKGWMALRKVIVRLLRRLLRLMEPSGGGRRVAISDTHQNRPRASRIPAVDPLARDRTRARRSERIW